MSEEPVAGDRVAFFFDSGATVPLWDEEGLLPDDPEWLQQQLGLSAELIADLAVWSAQQDLPGHPTEDDRQEEARLWDRFRGELNSRFTAVRRL